MKRPLAEMTIEDQAEAWWREQGKEVPARGTDEWDAMYVAWAHWAFTEACKEQKRRPPIGYWRQQSYFGFDASVVPTPSFAVEGRVTNL